MGWIDEQDKKYKRVLKLYNDVLKGELKDASLATKNNTKVVIAHMSEELSKLIGAKKGANIYLSYTTLEEHIKAHPEVNAFDYYLALYMAEQPFKVGIQDEKNKILFFKKLSFWYRVAFKAVKNNNKEAYLTSLVKSPRPFKEMKGLPIPSM